MVTRIFNQKKLKRKAENEKYLSEKLATRLEKNKDKHMKDEHTVVVSYDLENVFALPQAKISNFYYRRKYSVYNLTGYCSKNKVTYCSLWHEKISGRSGNDIASALIFILKRVVRDNPNVKNIILWSESCVPQNRNRVTSLALLKFLEENKHLNCIIQKFSEPGHSAIQEIDAVHSALERHLRDLEIYSPVSLIKFLKAMNYDKGWSE